MVYFLKQKRSMLLTLGSINVLTDNLANIGSLVVASINIPGNAAVGILMNVRCKAILVVPRV